MKRIASITLAAAAVAALVGVAAAQMGPGGPGPVATRGAGMMGGGPGSGGYPGWGTAPATAQVTDEKARELVQEYTGKYLPGFAVERVLPFSGMHDLTMYQAELKGPRGETRILHVSPWGGIMPFGGPLARR